MSKLGRTLWMHFPRRRRRFWRYVSPRRRGVGVTVLALLMLLVYGYWYLTNDGRIRDLARGYLAEFTGGKVDIKKAHFSLFGGVELARVSVDIPDDRSEGHFFAARTVILKHHPWALFLTGQLHPTEIICIEPTVKVEMDLQTNTFNFAKLLKLAQHPRAGGEQGGYWQLPPIHVRRGLLRMVDIEDNLPYAKNPVPLEMSMMPDGNGVYLVQFEEERIVGQPTIEGSLRLNLLSGEVSSLSGRVPVPRLENILPRKYSQWLQRYGLKGDFKLTRSLDEQSGQNAFQVALENLSLKLPASEGGMSLVNVSGKMLLRDDGVAVERITGQIGHAEGAKFTLEGRYGGYEVDSPFDMRLTVENLTFPVSGVAEGGLAAALEDFQRTCEPSGKVGVSVSFSRGGDGTIRYSGEGTLNGLEVLPPQARYLLKDIRGIVSFGNEGAKFTGLKARHGRSVITIDGEVSDISGGQDYRVEASAQDLSVDEELRSALPPDVQHVYDRFSPSGWASCELKAYRKGPQDYDHVDVTILLDGRASMTYKGFPYPVRNASGRIDIVGGNVKIQQVKGSNGPMRCTIDGTVNEMYSDKYRADLTITANELPVDDVLLGALSHNGRAAITALHPVAQAQRLRAQVTQTLKELDYNIAVTFKDAQLKPDVFPYEVSDASGWLTIRPDQVILEQVQGRHEKTPIAITGRLFLDEKQTGVDLRIDANDVQFDQELFGALQPAVRDVWETLSPAGRADINLLIQQDVPHQEQELTYRLLVNAKDMQIRYRDFPYTFRGISGQVVVTPGRVDLADVLSAQGSMRSRLSGTILMDDRGSRATLAIRAKDVPIDEALLAALPSELAPLAERFRTSGTCNVDLKRLEFTRPAATEPSPPASKAADSAPAMVAASRTTWSVEGSISAASAVLDLGGPKTITGTVTGKASRNADGLGLDAAVALDSVVVGKRQLTDLSGRVLKNPASPIIRMTDLAGKAHGGRLGPGKAEIKLTQPAQFSVYLPLDELQLDDLFNAGVTEKEKKINVSGLLSGTIQYTATAGDLASQQATGRLTISDAKLYKLPVMLGILQVLFLSLPSDSAFTEGNVVYELHGEKLIFREIHLDGSALSLVGSGTVNLRTEALNLRFLSGPPGKLPRIAALDTLLKGLVRELAEIHVTGTVTKPMPRTVSLPSLEEAIRHLTTAGEEKD